MAGRPKRPVILKKDNAVKRFDSIADAAAFLGVKRPSVSAVLKERGRHHKIHGFTAEYDSEYAPPKELKEDNTKYIGLEVEIEGVTYCSRSMPDKINCTTCDIFKARQPRNMAQVPLCYEYSIGKLGRRRVFTYCESNHTLIWKKK